MIPSFAKILPCNTGLRWPKHLAGKIVPDLALCAPAYASTLPAIQIEECRLVPSSAHQSMTPGQIAPNVALADCAWPGPTENPLPYIAALDLKGWHPELPPAPLVHAHQFLPASGGLARQLSGPVPVSSPTTTTGTDAGPLFYTHSPGQPRWRPETVPQPVGLPGAWLALLTALCGLWRMKR